MAWISDELTSQVNYRICAPVMLAIDFCRKSDTTPHTSLNIIRQTKQADAA